jgi:hypothetical protein
MTNVGDDVRASEPLSALFSEGLPQPTPLAGQAAKRLLSEGIGFKQCSNAFLKCSDPGKLQELADSLTAQDLLSCGQKWLACLTPFFKESERKEAGCQHRLFFSQVEYCDNLIFHRRAALDQLGQRLLDANRTIGQPKKITVIFGRKVTKQYKGKLQTVIEDLELPNPVIRSHYGKGAISSSGPPIPTKKGRLKEGFQDTDTLELAAGDTVRITRNFRDEGVVR